MLSETIKAKLKSLAHSSIEYPVTAETEDNDRGHWKYVLESTCPCAFHDESRWDNITIEAFDQEPVLDEKYKPLQEYSGEQIYEQLCILFQDYDCSIAVLGEQAADLSTWNYTTDVLFVVKVNDSKHSEPAKWITINHDRGCW